MSDAPPRPHAARVQHAFESVRRSRLRARAPRYLALATLLVLSLLGARELVFPDRPQRPPAAAASRSDAPAEDFALQFARAYLAYDAATPEARERALRPFIPRDLDVAAGFAPASGHADVLWAQVASSQPALAGGRVITVAAQTTAQPDPLYLAVTVDRVRGGALALGGYPALVGAPATSLGPTNTTREPVADRGVSEVSERVLANYLSGNGPNLEADLSPDAVVSLPTIELRLAAVDQLSWIDGPASNAVLATVEATDSTGSTRVLAYELGISYPERADRPYVDFVHVVPTGP